MRSVNGHSVFLTVGPLNLKYFHAPNFHLSSSGLQALLSRLSMHSLTSSCYFFGYKLTNFRYLAMSRCDVQMMGDEFSRKPYALAVQQGSPLKDKLNDVYVGLNSTYF